MVTIVEKPSLPWTKAEWKLLQRTMQSSTQASCWSMQKLSLCICINISHCREKKAKSRTKHLVKHSPIWKQMLRTVNQTKEGQGLVEEQKEKNKKTIQISQITL